MKCKNIIQLLRRIYQYEWVKTENIVLKNFETWTPALELVDVNLSREEVIVSANEDNEMRVL